MDLIFGGGEKWTTFKSHHPWVPHPLTHISHLILSLYDINWVKNAKCQHKLFVRTALFWVNANIHYDAFKQRRLNINCDYLSASLF